MKDFCFLALLFLSGGLLAQPSGPEELRAFTRVYFESKAVAAADEKLVMQLMTEYEVSPERYREMLAGIEGKRTTLTDREQAFVAAIEKENRKIEIRKDRQLRRLCKHAGIAYDRYTQLLGQYHRDIAFQRSLKPYFDAHLKTLHR
ncbi:MAG: hypothetical protein R3301_15525 [Saprospiraceae bacterium]|nr:hypothetical protein [Saprospiraceae bacterium]